MKMKTVFVVTVMAAALNVGIANASHEIGGDVAKPVVKDSHISWHEFRHELGSYGNVTASISHTGLVTLEGTVDDGITKSTIERIARNIRGATEIHNNISSN